MNAIRIGCQRIKERWQSVGIVPRPGCTQSEIEQFEDSHHVVLPQAMRQFHEFMDGMPDGVLVIEEALMNFWPLSKIHSVPVIFSHCCYIPDYSGIETALPDASSYYVVADHSILICAYAVRLTQDPMNEGPVLIIQNGKTWRQQWSSYSDFLQCYADDPWHLI